MRHFLLTASLLVAAPVLAAVPVARQSPPMPPPVVVAEPELTIADALRPLSDLIAHGESLTAGDYNAANNGWAMDLGKHGLRRYFGRDCSDVTIGEVMLAQDQRQLHAVGRYQIIGSTMAAAVRWASLSGSDLFTPDNQDKLFLALIKHKRPSVWSYLNGSGSAHHAANGLAREWSSFPAPWGGSYYSSGDQAHVSRDRVLLALQQTRKAVSLLT